MNNMNAYLLILVNMCTTYAYPGDIIKYKCIDDVSVYNLKYGMADMYYTCRMDVTIKQTGDLYVYTCDMAEVKAQMVDVKVNGRMNSLLSKIEKCRLDIKMDCYGKASAINLSLKMNDEMDVKDIKYIKINVISYFVRSILGDMYPEYDTSSDMVVTKPRKWTDYEISKVVNMAEDEKVEYKLERVSNSIIKMTCNKQESNHDVSPEYDASTKIEILRDVERGCNMRGINRNDVVYAKEGRSAYIMFEYELNAR